ncbi:MAG: hypothetical protein OXC48_08680 [Endozoicomonadaceae bacterium]|nr:hypothetical protein [Endozoicomonadaceae bacterium]
MSKKCTAGHGFMPYQRLINDQLEVKMHRLSLKKALYETSNENDSLGA